MSPDALLTAACPHRALACVNTVASPTLPSTDPSDDASSYERKQRRSHLCCPHERAAATGPHSTSGGRLSPSSIPVAALTTLQAGTFASPPRGNTADANKRKRSEHCYVIKTWTFRMDSMTWVVDGMMDSTELWADDSYKGLPRL
ncbi:hypothetical protein HU200_033123 [Digitaria exilis]|uniref:Uncharacterized protein n=1 Tax=Digitaria exilis TaxID=1010633 RepID=A0A835EN19_9POAL|nr:hypothetical protein HU200_033123 [Digitaria exilis]